ncbi:uncharacterized protein [Centroberyx affinis]|uniref:uncharacterized protein n=1 Tax=Centroberyx affinis TaxID=166261 RepID=UPI003A5C2428
MLKILLSELHHSLIWKKCGTLWIFLCFTLSGIQSLITVYQPPVVVAPLSHDVTMQCELTASPEEKMITIPVLYWEFLKSDEPGVWPKLWPAAQQYKGRVERLDINLKSSNKSIRFKNIQWEDSGPYQCKLSIATESSGSERKKGKGTKLMVYDTMFFSTAENDTQLHCAVNVSWDPGFVLSVSRGGFNQSCVSAPRENVPALPYVTLSGTFPLGSRGGYDCQLHLNGTQITKKSIHHNPPEPDELKVYPEPWLLYTAIVLVPFTVLLVMITALLIYRR